MAQGQASPTRHQVPPPSGDAAQDVWLELFTTVRNLTETVELATQAFANDEPGKVVSATTKKRLLIKALHGLKQSSSSIQVHEIHHACMQDRLTILSTNDLQLLTEHLKALQVASQQWQRTMLYASKR